MVNLRRVSVVIALALLVPLVPFLIVGELPGERWLSNADHSARLFGATGAGLLTADVLLPVPSSIIGSLLGARLGLTVGFAWTFAGLTAGSLAGYGIGRLALAGFGAQALTTPTLIGVLLSRPVPVLAETMSLAAGGTRVAFLRFAAVAVAGNAFYAAVLTANGAALLPTGFVGPGLVLPLLVPVIGWLVWKRLSGRHAAGAHPSGT